MNRSFEAALTARLLWIDVAWLREVAGAERATEAAIQAAFSAVDWLVAVELHLRSHYGATPPLLLQDTPQLAARYVQVYEESLRDAEGQNVSLQELEYQHERDQYMQDLADTYAETERELAAGWKADCLDNDLL